MSRKLWTYHGGLHLPDEKEISTARPLATLPLPRQLTIPLQQHIGEPTTPLVKVGDKVLKGQKIADAGAYVSAPLHAPSSGTVTAIGMAAVPHPSGMSAAAITIETDGEDRWIEDRNPVSDHKSLNPTELREKVHQAGIVGLGGAGFPSFIKLNPGARTSIDSLIINGAECEPYISCDDMLMRSRPEAVLEGAQIMAHALHADTIIIAIEENKPDAYAALRAALHGCGCSNVELVMIPTHYPSGGEKQLIKVITGREVPQNGLPIDLGIVCHNVATAASVFDAVIQDQPLISRIITVTGEGVAQPQNLIVPLGAPIESLVEACGGYTEQAERLVMGGPMMGFAIHSDEVPVIKTANCFLLTRIPATEQSVRPCIRCGACADVCPAQLLPQQLFWYAQANDFEKVQDYNLFDCIECGCCSHVCPSHLPLVHFYRYAKNEIWEQERERGKADIARQRHEARQERQARDKAEREAKLRKKREALKAKQSGSDKKDEKDSKQAAIQAALDRVRAKQNGGDDKPKNIDNLTPEQQRAIDEADARRQRMRDQEQQPNTKGEGKS